MYMLMNEKQRQIQEKCIAFAVRADKLRKYLNKEKKEFNKADQVDRSASAIGDYIVRQYMQKVKQIIYIN